MVSATMVGSPSEEPASGGNLNLFSHPWASSDLQDGIDRGPRCTIIPCPSFVSVGKGLRSASGQPPEQRNAPRIGCRVQNMRRS